MFQILKMSETETVVVRVRAAKQPPDKGGSHVKMLGKENLAPCHNKPEHQNKIQDQGPRTKNVARKPFSTLNSTNAISTAIQLCAAFANDTLPESSSGCELCEDIQPGSLSGILKKESNVEVSKKRVLSHSELWAKILSGDCAIQFRRLDPETTQYYGSVLFGVDYIKSNDFLQTLIINKIKEESPKHKQEQIMRRMGLEQSIVEKIQKNLSRFLGKFKTAPGKQKQSEQKEVKKNKNETEKRVTRGSLQRSGTSHNVSKSNDNDGEDDDKDNNEDRRRKQKNNLAPLSSDTSAEETASDIVTDDDEDESDGEYIKKKFEKKKVFVHNSIRNPKLKKGYWSKMEKRNQTKNILGHFQDRFSIDPPNDGFVWSLNKTFRMKKGFAPAKKFNPSIQKTKKFRKYTWGHYKIDKKYACSEKGCKAKKITTKPEHYKGKTFLYLTVYKRLHNHSSNPPESVSKRNRDSTDSIEDERRKKKEKISQNTSKRKIQSSSSKGEDSTQGKKQNASKKKPSKKKRRESILAISKQLFSGPTKKDNNSSKEGMSDSFERDIKGLSDNSSGERKMSKKTNKEEKSSDSSSDFKISEASSAKETTVSPIRPDQDQKKKKRESNIDRLKKRFEQNYKKNDPHPIQSENSDSSSQRKGKRLHVSDIFSETSSDDFSGTMLTDPMHKSTPILSNSDEDVKDSNVSEKIVPHREQSENQQHVKAGIGIGTQNELLKPWSQDPDCEAKQSEEIEVKSSQPGNPKHKSTPINSSDITVLSKNVTEDQSEKSQDKQAGIGLCTQEKLLEPWSQDPSIERMQTGAKEVKSSQPGKPDHKSTPINSSEITVLSKKMTEDESLVNPTKISSQQLENESEIMSPVIKSSRKRDFKKPSMSTSKDNSQGILTDQPTDAETEPLPFVDSWNDQSQFHLSSPLQVHEDNAPPLDDQDVQLRMKDEGTAKLEELKQKCKEIEREYVDENIAVQTIKVFQARQKIMQDHRYTLDERTPADDECFFHAIIQQGKRPEVFRVLPEDIKKIVTSGDSMKLRNSIVDYMANEENEKVEAIKRNYQISRELLCNMPKNWIGWREYPEWEVYLKDMRERSTWADDKVLRVAAILLKMDIFVITEKSEPNSGTHFRSDGSESGSGALSNPYILIGGYDQRHFQSLLPRKIESSNQEKSQLILKTKNTDGQVQTPKAKKMKINLEGISPLKAYSEDHGLQTQLQEFIKKCDKIEATDVDMAQKACELLSLKQGFFKEPYKLDQMTPANSNNFFHAIIQHGMRPNIFEKLPPELKSIVNANNPSKLRETIVEFMMNNEENQEIVGFRTNYMQSEAEIQEPWKSLCEKLSNPKTYPTEELLKATCFLLNWDLGVFSLEELPGCANLFHRNYHESIVDKSICTDEADQLFMLGMVEFREKSSKLIHYQLLLPHNDSDSEVTTEEEQGQTLEINNSQRESEFQTPKKDTKKKCTASNTPLAKQSNKASNTPIAKHPNKFKVYLDENFSDIKDEPNSMYIFTDLQKIDFGRGSKYPAVNRNVYKWAGRANTRQKDNLPIIFKCKGLENGACKATRTQYYCEKNCRKPHLGNKCCETGTDILKLVVVFEGTHECENQLYQVISKEEIEKNLVDCFKEFSLHSGFHQLPSDVNGNVLYVLPLKPEKEESIGNQVKCGRIYGKLKKNNKVSVEERQIFGPCTQKDDIEKKKGHCKGFYQCRNMNCPYYERFNAINQVIMIIIIHYWLCLVYRRISNFYFFI